MEINKPLIIIGGSGHGSIIEACLKDNRRRYNDLEWDLKGFCNDFDVEVDGYPVLGKLSDIPRLIEEGQIFPRKNLQLLFIIQLSLMIRLLLSLVVLSCIMPT